MPRLAFRRKKKIHVISNENSGKDMGRKRERDIIIGMLENAFPRAKHSEADLSIFRTHTLSDLDAAKAKMRGEFPDIIAIFSGDGGIHKLLGEEDGFLEDLLMGPNAPMFIFYRMGSTNTINGALNLLGRDQVKATARIINKIKRGDHPLDVIHRRYLKFNGKKGFIYGSGFAGNLLEKYNAKSPKGVRRVMKVGAWMLFNEIWRFLPPWRRASVARKVPLAFEYWNEGGVVAKGVTDSSGVVASSLEQVGMGCRLTQAVVSDEEVDRFQCIISKMGFWRTVATIPSWYQGILPGGMVDGLATKVVLEYGEPVIHTIDGELYGREEMTERVVIESGPLLSIVLS